MLLKQNKLTEALSKIKEGLDKIDHRAIEANLVKVDVLVAMNMYGEAKETLNNLIEWHVEQKEKLENKLSQVTEKEKSMD